MPKPAFSLFRAAIAVVLSFLSISFSYSQAAQSIDPNRFSVPHEFGSVSQRHINEFADGTIVIIQDMHANEQAQRNASQILDYLATQYGLRLILVEGDTGEIGLDGFAGQSTSLTRRAIAESFLSQGIFGAHEYLDVISDKPIDLWGVEDPELYARNVERLIFAERISQALQDDLIFLGKQIDAMKDQVLSPDLLEVYGIRDAYDSRGATFEESIDALLRIGMQYGLPVTDFTEVRRYLELKEAGTGLDIDAAQAQRQQLLEFLEASSTSEDWSTVRQSLMGFREGRLSRESFYHILAALADRYSDAAPPHPDFRQYVRYLKLNEALQPRALLREFEQLIQRLPARIAATQEERDWVRFEEQVSRLLRLSALEWTYEDYKAYLNDPVLLDIEYLLDWLSSRISEEDRFELNLISAMFVYNQLKRMTDFYEMAHQRDVAIAQESARKMQEEETQVAALILGGFHTENVTEILKQMGYQVLIVTPYGQQVEGDARYPFLLRAKFQNGRLLRDTPEPN